MYKTVSHRIARVSYQTNCALTTSVEIIPVRAAIVNDHSYAKPPLSVLLRGGVSDCLKDLAFNVAAFIE